MLASGFPDIAADGFSLDDKRSPIEQNDIPDVIKKFQTRFDTPDTERTEQCFFVLKDEIVGNGYDLSINKYKKTEYVAVEYPPTEEIIASIDDIEKQIVVEFEELKKLLAK